MKGWFFTNQVPGIRKNTFATFIPSFTHSFTHACVNILLAVDWKSVHTLKSGMYVFTAF